MLFDLLFYLTWVLISSSVFSPSDGTETERAEAAAVRPIITQAVDKVTSRATDPRSPRLVAELDLDTSRSSNMASSV